MSLASQALSGDRRALARLLTAIENNSGDTPKALDEIFPHTGRAHIIGVTGAPGTGKSSLVNQFALNLRGQNKRVGIIAVDPTSPFSGGAILGDRIRMRDLSGDPDVFIRSMATRGSLGGLARATADAARVLDAAGFDAVLIETVGAGQSEVDIARHSQTVIVVEAPGLGDDVQAIKAGILEIADVLVVNKADDPRAKNTTRALKAMLDLGNLRASQPMVNHHGKLMLILAAQPPPAHTPKGWEIPVQETVAIDGTGIPKLAALVESHRAYLRESGELERRTATQMASELDDLLREALLERLLASLDEAAVADVMEHIMARELSPYAAAQALIERMAV